jgi:hypothetical protein
MEVTNLLMVLRFNMEYCFWDELLMRAKVLVEYWR